MVDPSRVFETAAGGNLAFLIQKLASLTIDEVSQLRISDNIDWLKDELHLFRAILEDLSHDEHPTEQDKLWKSKIRELAYDMEDAIDDFMLRSNNTPPGGRDQQAQEDPGFFIETIQSCIDRFKSLASDYGMATKIQRLKEKVIKSLQEGEPSKRQKIGGNGDGPSHDFTARRDVAQYASQADLVGTKGPSDQIIDLLLKDKEASSSSGGPCKVVAIVGFGGLGKTTLAKQVFDHIKGTFDLKAFVSVSRNPDIKTVLLDILESFGLGQKEQKTLQQKNEARIIQKIREYIGEKRYLVVVDDIWSEDAWITLKAALFDNNCDSNIIVTTRKDEVATAACFSSNSNHVYRMQPLSYKDSELLFLKRTFRGKECPAYLQVVCGEVLKKCAGSPLAILVLSGLLINKVTVSQWRYVLKTMSSGDSKYDVVRRIISLSYFDLPLHLRTCLMYLSIFPEDFEISRKRLVNRWIAEGFVSSTDGISITENADGYFSELISRNLIQAVDIKYDGQARACRVHDTILDFIVSKAREENFISFSGRQLSRPGNKVRRLSIQNCQDGKELAAEDLSFVRSISFFGSSQDFLCTFCLRGCNNLRVLDTRDAFSNENGEGCVFHFDVATLPHLKYLDLFGLSSEGFFTPRVLRGIANLQYLETLDLRTTLVWELPTDVYKLQWLARLFIDPEVRLPDGIGQMKALEELKCIGIHGCFSLEFLQELGHLTKLGSIRVKIEGEGGYIGDQHELILISSFEKLSKSNLRSLKIDLPDPRVNQYVNNRWPVSAEISWQTALQGLRKFKMEGGYFTKVPDWMGTLNGLEKLVLEVKEMDQNGLDILGELQSLFHLWFIAYSPEQRLTFRENKGFQSLKYLRTGGWRKGGVTLTFQAGSVPRLEQLRLLIHTDDNTAPGHSYVSGIEHLDSLTTVSVIINYKEPCLHGVVTAAKNAISDAVNKLPNKPTLTIQSCPKLH